MANKLTPENITLLKGTKSITDWNAATNTIKSENGGVLPSDWWTEVMNSGLANDIMASWPPPAEEAIVVDEPMDLDLGPGGLPPGDITSVLSKLMGLLMGGGPGGGLLNPAFEVPKDVSVPMVYETDEMEFALADVLSVTLGFLFDNERGMRAPHGVMHFMMGGGTPLTGQEMQMYQWPVTQAIYKQHPQLQAIELERDELMALKRSQALMTDTLPFLTRQYEKYGKTVKLKFDLKK